MFERFTRSAREAVIAAQEEARGLGARQIDPAHLLLGVLGQAEPGLTEVLAARAITAAGVRAALADQARHTSLGADDAAALRSIGIDLDAVQASVAENFGPDAWDRAEPQPKRGLLGRFLGGDHGHIPFTPVAKKSLELSLREAVHRKAREIDSVYVLLGILRADDTPTVELLGGPDAVAGLRADIYASLDRAA